MKAGLATFMLVFSSLGSGIGLQAFAQSAPSVHFSPEEDLEAVDIRALDALPAGGHVNAALFVLSDYRVIFAFLRAAERGKQVRLYLDPRELRSLRLRLDHPLCRLARHSNVHIKVKSSEAELMHDKDWSADAVLWRSGSANASVSGLKSQDNSLIFLSDRSAVAAFDRHFETIWARPDNDELSGC